MRNLVYTLYTILFLHCIYSQESSLSLCLQTKPVLPINKEVLDKISEAIESKKEHEESPLTYYMRFIPRDLDNNEVILAKTLGCKSSFTNLTLQQDIYKKLLLLNKALQQWPVELNDQEQREYLPQELINHILSYLNEHQIGKYTYLNLDEDKNYIYDRPINILSKNQYYISHADLFLLISNLKLYSNENNNYVLGYCSDCIELPSYLNPYINTLLAIVNNQALHEEFNLRTHNCRGATLFLYYSGRCSLINPMPGRFKIKFSNMVYNIECDFNKHFINWDNSPSMTSQQDILFQLQALKKHLLDEQCIWCNLYQ